MRSQIFRTKSLDATRVGSRGSAASAQAHARRLRRRHAGHRRHHRRRHLRDHRHGRRRRRGAARRRPGAHPVLRPHRASPAGSRRSATPSSPRWCRSPGSAYTYAYATLGELVAWIIGWDLIIEYAVGNVAVAISWGNYFKTLVAGFGIVIPDWLSTDYRTAAQIPGLFESAPHLFGVPIVFNILAFGIVALITIVLVIGIRESASLNAGMVVVKLVVLGVLRRRRMELRRARELAAVRAERVGRHSGGRGDRLLRLHRLRRRLDGRRGDAGIPKRDLPIGIIGSLIICTIIYIVVAAVFTGIIPYDVLVHEARDRAGRAADDGAAVRQHRARNLVGRASSPSDRSSRTPPCCSSSSSASRGSSSRWRATDCFRRASRGCIRGFERRT